ncbi:MAG TPA: prolyl oligopeptidase family serine peptidase [Myxococcaceae bacterium]|nr:prolyl oligopeptidase family serine peptidase [Myxococcaceae bacterium]
MRAALLASLPLALLACSHAPAPAAPPPASARAQAADAGVALTYPVARKVDVVDDYHGTKVADPYRWLEDPASPGYQEWIDAEQSLTERFLSTIPDRGPLRERLTALWDYERYGVPFREGKRVFFERNSGLQNQPVLHVVDLPRFEPRVLLDPNTLSKDGTVALARAVPSRDASLVAYGLAEAGSDWEEWRVRKTDTGEDLPDRIQWVKFSAAEWTPDGHGFYYSRFDEHGPNQLRDTNYFQKLYYHRLGTPQSADRLVYERKDQKEWGFGATVSDDGRWLVIAVSQGTDPRNRVYLQDLHQKGSKVRPLIDVLEARYEFIGSQGPVLWFLTTLDAPKGKILAIDMRAPDRARWKTLVPETDARLQEAAAVGRRFVLNYLQDAHSVVEIHRLDGKLQQKLNLPSLGTAKGFAGRLTQDETYFSFETYASPPAILRLQPGSGTLRVFRAPQLKFEPNEYDSQQVFYPSKDGTRVPMTLSFRKGTTPDGNRPVLLYGYGGFDISETPRFSPTWLAWMERGGVLAVPNIRGGGEYGEAWHLAGTKLKKQNVFDDFIAAAEWLVKERWTVPARLAIEGGSNGGLLVGAVMTQRPDLFGCALPAVGVMDMLRFQKFTIGWAWTSDFGSSDDPEQFKAIYAYSPLQNIRPGTAYPPTLAMTADHDDRVVPAHTFKFIATLQAAQAGPAPVLVRIETRAGHSAGKPTTKKIEEAADMLAFATWALQLPGGRPGL